MKTSDNINKKSQHHHHSHSHSHSHSSDKNLTVAFWLNAVFVVVEAIGGMLTNSIAILSDALHDLGDCASLGIAWWLQKKSKQGCNTTFTYGYKRFSLLGSVFLSAILLTSSLFMLYQCVVRIISPAEVEAKGMLWLAIAGIVINGSAALRLKRGSSLNERAVYLHIMEDVLGWVAVLVASIVMMFADLPILDPIMSAAISLWILWNVAHNLKETFRIFLQAVPEGLDLEALKKGLMGIEGVEEIHDLHVWTHDGETHVMSLHVKSDAEDLHALKEMIRSKAKEFDIEHATIEMETLEEECIDRCSMAETATESCNK